MAYEKILTTLSDPTRDMREGYNNGWVWVFENAFGGACRG